MVEVSNGISDEDREFGEFIWASQPDGIPPNAAAYSKDDLARLINVAPETVTDAMIEINLRALSVKMRPPVWRIAAQNGDVVFMIDNAFLEWFQSLSDDDD